MPFYESTTFNRQKPIGNYIVDFYCHQFQLVIEIDGDSHGKPVTQSNDMKRTEFLEAQGLTVWRFTNREVMDNIEAVMIEIENFIKKGKSPRSRWYELIIFPTRHEYFVEAEALNGPLFLKEGLGWFTSSIIKYRLKPIQPFNLSRTQPQSAFGKSNRRGGNKIADWWWSHT